MNTGDTPKSLLPRDQYSHVWVSSQCNKGTHMIQASLLSRGLAIMGNPHGARRDKQLPSCCCRVWPLWVTPQCKKGGNMKQPFPLPWSLSIMGNPTVQEENSRSHRHVSVHPQFSDVEGPERHPKMVLSPPNTRSEIHDAQSGTQCIHNPLM